MTRVILQVPMPKELKNQAEKVAQDEGFSSLQEIIRLLVNKLVKREIAINIGEPAEYVHLSAKAKKRYERITEEIEKGIGVTKTNNVNELLKLLES